MTHLIDDLIPVSAPMMIGNERLYLGECVDSGWLGTHGPFVGKFEAACAKYFGRQYAVATCNATSALHLVAAALLAPGDEVIAPTFAFVGCITGLHHHGIKFAFVDCHGSTWNMDVDDIESRITPRTRAILAVHNYGLPVDMDPLLAIANKHKLLVIEDASEAHGVTYKGRRCGSFGGVSVVSFASTKNVACGQGGMIFTDNEHLAATVRDMSRLSYERRALHTFRHTKFSWHYTMSNIQAAVGLAQLEQLDRTLERKAAIAAQYTRLLYDEYDLQRPLRETAHAQNRYWLYPVVSRVLPSDIIMARLRDAGVDTWPFWWPLHDQAELRGSHYGNFPVAESIANYGFCLPSGAGLTNAQVEYIAKSVKSALRA